MMKRQWLNVETGETKWVYANAAVKGAAWVSIPEDADICVRLNSVTHAFYKSGYKFVWSYDGWIATDYDEENLAYWKDSLVIWKREDVVTTECQSVSENSDNETLIKKANELLDRADLLVDRIITNAHAAQTIADNKVQSNTLNIADTRDERVIYFEKFLNGEKVQYYYGDSWDDLKDTSLKYLTDKKIKLRLDPKPISCDGRRFANKQEVIDYLNTKYE